MLIPYKTNVILSNFPLGNFFLFLVIILVQIFERFLPDESLNFMKASLENPLGLFLYFFRHAGLLHLVSNLIFLWVFGNPVCDRIGNILYVILFCCFGIFSGIFHILSSSIPVVGASGAINGITGIFLLLFAGNKVKCMLFLFIPFFFEVRAYYIILLWGFLDLLGIALDLPGVAYIAHGVGFASGFFTGLYLLKLTSVIPKLESDSYLL